MKLNFKIFFVAIKILLFFFSEFYLMCVHACGYGYVCVGVGASSKEVEHLIDVRLVLMQMMWLEWVGAE